MRVLHWTTVLAVLCFTIFGIALSVSLAWGADDQRELERVSRANCIQIEELKQEFREQALESYRNLEQNARLLGITVTPELRRAAIQGRDGRLARFAAREC